MAEKLGPAKVVFACVANAGRSQMAAAFFNTLANPARARAISAGTRPETAVHPEVVTVMQELGIDLSAAKPQYLSTRSHEGRAHRHHNGMRRRMPADPRRRARRMAVGRPERTTAGNGAAHPGRDKEESGGVGQGAEVEIASDSRFSSRHLRRLRHFGRR